MMNSEKVASGRFAEFNELYFGNRLPTYRILRRGRFGGGGLCRKREREIHLPPGIEGTELNRVLVHEMAHAAAKGNGHGKAWRSEMQRLAEMGAPGALEDLTAYLNPLHVISDRELIAEARDHGLMNPDQKWKGYKVWFGQQYGTTDRCGDPESRAAARFIARVRKEFLAGQREAKQMARAAAQMKAS